MAEKISTMLLFVLAINLWVGTLENKNNHINYSPPTIENSISHD